MCKIKLSLIILLSFIVLSSCNKDNGIEYIPENAVIVAKINTAQIVKDAFVDFASEANLITDMINSFPEYADFAEAGIDEINQFYFFAQIPSIEKTNLAAIVPLKDTDLFKKFIENRFKTKINTENSYEYININGKYVITWNKKMALFYYADNLNLNIVSDAIKIIDNDIVNISSKGDLYNKFNDSEDHVLIWVNNINNSILKDKLEELNLPKDEVHSFTSINFNSGKIDIQSNSYYTDENTILKNILHNDKSIDSLIKSSGNEEPLVVASMALNLNGIIDFLNTNEELYNNLQANVPFVNIKDFINMFSGDFLLTFNDVEEEVVQFYDEKIINGVLEVVPDEKVLKTPYITYAIGLNDSKKLSEKKRLQLAEEIKAKALSWSLGRAEVAEIDSLNILHATMLAMQRAVAGLHIQPEWVLVDGNRVPDGLKHFGSAVVKGDSLVPEISAASIIAKVARDAEMTELHQQYPEYNFAGHKGYPTAEHLAAIKTHGVIAEHRRSFKPVRDVLEQMHG